MTYDADVLILGGGCAGLSLAVALSLYAPKLRVHLLESRTEYRRDRTWCFWDTTRHPFLSGVTHHWHSWRVQHGGQEARQRSTKYSYQHLPADRFYAMATSTIHRRDQQLSMGIAVQSVQESSNAWTAHTSAGSLRARWVFDSRPPTVWEQAPAFVQRFDGWRVRCEHPCFDPSTVDLMNFIEPELCGRTAFIYTLPFSSTEALVEATYLDPPSLSPDDGGAALKQYLERMRAGAFEVLYRESGTIPMGTTRKTARARGTRIDIGTRGGRVKPSSGYAFQRIQRHSIALAKALARDLPLPLTCEPRLYGLLDRIFLAALKLAPHRTADYFFQLFQRVAPDTLVRFLTETANPIEVMQVMLALPKADFLWAACSLLSQGALS